MIEDLLELLASLMLIAAFGGLVVGGMLLFTWAAGAPI